ncbi:Mitochondrial import inner membrane translocase subunit Tim9 [Sesamum angolense]|uniref:Mitochondrial import inner membrane translocase subunit n=1 Tax=Sesamum angolense TaxID=2727404 RepID=A0AAE1XCC4_9LAMI|nr:Mitochondrial import inner membrane translocase subunit Tim9 [Sesamum angolense]
MDKTLLAADLSSLPEADKATISAVVDQLQTRDSLRMYNALVERCFNDCVDSFYRKTLEPPQRTKDFHEASLEPSSRHKYKQLVLHANLCMHRTNEQSSRKPKAVLRRVGKREDLRCGTRKKATRQAGPKA